MNLGLQYSWILLLLFGQSLTLNAQRTSYASSNNEHKNTSIHQGQSVRGKIVDEASNEPLIYVTVELLNHSPIISTVTDENGVFELVNIPVGRQQIYIDRHEYYPRIQNVLVGAGKEVVLTISLEEEYVKLVTAASADEPAQKSQSRLRNVKLEPVNETSSLSGRKIEFEEVNRYAGSLEDPARAASNFAGIYNIDDPQNYMVIRGNSPFGVRWQIDGIPVDNPHHLARMGKTGAIFPILNTNVLDKSELLTGAFAAEYGNATAGIFDIQSRQGNNENLEFAGEISLWGLEIMLEGPIKKGGASFIVSYRHSIVQFAQQLGINTTSNARPQYQDLNVKVDLPTKNAGHFSLFAIGGISNVHHAASEYQASDILALKNINNQTETQMSLVGLSHEKAIGDKSHLKTTVSYLFESYASNKDSVSTGDSLVMVTIDTTIKISFDTAIAHLDTTFIKKVDTTTATIVDTIILSPKNVLLDYYQARSIRSRIGLSSTFNTKWNSRLTTRAGVYGYLFMLDIKESNLYKDNLVYFSDDVLLHVGGFMQAKFKVSPRFVINAGVHGQYFSLNNKSWSVEPRLGFNWYPSSRHKVSFGYSWNSRIKPFSILFYVEPDIDSATGYNNSNRELGLLSSHHGVLSYSFYFAEKWAMKINAYGQYNNNFSIDQLPSSFSLANYGAYETPKRTNLVDEGESVNLGGELSIEKILSQGYYGIISGSYFRSLYRGSDDAWHNTSFDIQYLTQLVIGKEFKMGPKKRSAFTIDARVVHRGGTPYTPILLEESKAKGTAVYDETKINSVQLAPYTRIDVKIGARFNSKKISHYFFIDLINVANFNNPRTIYYDSEKEAVLTGQQFGFIPNILYRIQF